MELTRLDLENLQRLQPLFTRAVVATEKAILAHLAALWICDDADGWAAELTRLTAQKEALRLGLIEIQSQVGAAHRHAVAQQTAPRRDAIAQLVGERAGLLGEMDTLGPYDDKRAIEIHRRLRKINETLQNAAAGMPVDLDAVLDPVRRLAALERYLGQDESPERGEADA